MVVKVSEIIHSDYAAYQKEGRNVFHVIEREFLNRQEVIVVSFKDVHACSFEFLLASVGCLYNRYNENDLDKVITIVDFFQVDSFEEMLRNVRRSSISLETPLKFRVEEPKAASH